MPSVISPTHAAMCGYVQSGSPRMASRTMGVPLTSWTSAVGAEGRSAATERRANSALRSSQPGSSFTRRPSA